MEEMKIQLSALWIALMLTYLLGDVLRIFSGGRESLWSIQSISIQLKSAFLQAYMNFRLVSTCQDTNRMHK